MSPTLRRVALALALAGLAASAASAYVHSRLLENPGYLSFCDFNATLSCTQVYLSRFATIGGVPVSVPATLWFVLVVILLALARGSGPLVENIPGYVFALSTLALVPVLYLAYASFFILKTACVLCLVTDVAVIGLFLLSGIATAHPMKTLPRRAWRDVGRLGASPLGIIIVLAYLGGAASVLAFFPRASGSGAPRVSLDQDTRSEFERWYSSQPRVTVPVPDDGAAVLIVKFNDYQCPACGQTYMEYKDVLARYEQERPRDVKFIAKDYPLEPECNVNVPKGTHIAACEAAVAVRLARQHRREAEMANWLFTNQSLLSPAAVREAARSVGQVTDFEAQYPRELEQVKTDVALGRLLGVRVTPTFFINGVKVDGGLQPQYFVAAIEYELKRAGKSKS